MFGVNPIRVHKILGLMVTLGLLCGLHSATAQEIRLSFNELVSKADTVFVATCTQRHTDYINGKLVTRYTLSPSEFLKGAAKLDGNGAVMVEEIGGQLEDGPLPLAQYHPNMADIKKGEEVLLFANQRKSKERSSGTTAQNIFTPGSLRVTAGLQGRYSVFSDPETGEKLVSRYDGNGAMRNSLERARARSKDSAKVSSQVSQKLRSAQAAAQSERDRQAKNDSTRADDIYMFEPLSSVRARVAKSAAKAE